MRWAKELLEVSGGDDQAQSAAVVGGAKVNSAGLPILTPTKVRLAGHDVYYESPPSPVGLLLIMHKCGRSGSDHWPRTKGCPECLGLPQSLAKTKQALSRGYAVAAMSSADRSTGAGARCFSWAADAEAAAAVVARLPRTLGMPAGAPVYLDGASSGGSLAIRLPSIVQVQGVVGEVIAPPGLGDILDRMKAGETSMPPALYIHMPLDTGMAAKVAENIAALRQHKVPTTQVKMHPRKLGSAFFSDCSHSISPRLSAELYKRISGLKLLDGQGFIKEAPSGADWNSFKRVASSDAALGKLLASMKPQQGEQSTKVVSPHIWECLNIAWARHETVGEHMAAALAWLESKGRADMVALVERYRPSRLSGLVIDTSGWRRPPARRRLLAQ